RRRRVSGPAHLPRAVAPRRLAAGNPLRRRAGPRAPRARAHAGPSRGHLPRRADLSCPEPPGARPSRGSRPGARPLSMRPSLRGRDADPWLVFPTLAVVGALGHSRDTVRLPIDVDGDVLTARTN